MPCNGKSSLEVKRRWPEFLGDDGVVVFGCAQRGRLGIICVSKDWFGCWGAELSVYSQGWQLVQGWVTASGWARGRHWPRHRHGGVLGGFGSDGRKMRDGAGQSNGPVLVSAQPCKALGSV